MHFNESERANGAGPLRAMDVAQTGSAESDFACVEIEKGTQKGKLVGLKGHGRGFRLKAFSLRLFEGEVQWGGVVVSKGLKARPTGASA